MVAVVPGEWAAGHVACALRASLSCDFFFLFFVVKEPFFFGHLALFFLRKFRNDRW